MSLDELLVLFDVAAERFKRQAELFVGSMGGKFGPDKRKDDIVIDNANDLKQLPFGVGHTTIEKEKS